MDMDAVTFLLSLTSIGVIVLFVIVIIALRQL